MVRCAVLAAAFLITGVQPAAAHGFGQRFVLPLPLWLWVAGAGLTIVLSFVVMAVFVREHHGAADYPRYDLSRLAFLQILRGPVAIETLRACGAAIFLLVVLAGFSGSQDPYANIATTFVWVIWWVGVAFVCALAGNVWAWLNPFHTLFLWAECGYAMVSGGRALSRSLPYRFGVWPAVAVLLVFAWGELVWGANDVPRNLAWSITGYAVVTWAGMVLWGRSVWLANGEAFAVAFGVLARFAPLEMREGRLWLRPYGAGLLQEAGARVSFLVFVLLMLATVTFDGFLEAPLFQSLTNALYSSRGVANLLFRMSDLGVSDLQLIMTAALLVFPAVFLAAYWTTSWGMVRATARFAPGALTPTVTAVACAFVLTLVPIAVAYHLSHYFALLLTAGQFIIPLLSDPFGWGWDLFGTADYRVNVGLVSPYVFWYGATTIIVIGHGIAVYLAHVVALRVFGSRRGALISQVPMVTLMVAYTMVSLWILAQPVVG